MAVTEKPAALREPKGKRRLFCELYISDTGLNGAAAARKAGYAPDSVRETAYKLLNAPDCVAYIAKLQAARRERLQVDADYVLLQLHAIDQMDIIDILEDDLTLKPLSTWPQVWRRYLNGFELAELFEGQGDARKLMGVLKKIKWVDKLRNLELLGKHINVGAFREQLLVEDAAGLADKLTAARKRAAQAAE
ncbi:Terminase small subunit [compost metagenome]